MIKLDDYTNGPSISGHCKFLGAFGVHKVAAAPDAVEWPTEVENLVAGGVGDADVQLSGDPATEPHAKPRGLFGPVDDLTLTSVDGVLLLYLENVIKE